MAGGKELKLAISIGGKIDKSLGAAINNAQSQLNKIDKFANTVGKAATGAVVAGATKIVTDSVKTYAEYESALNSAAATAGVEKGSAAYEAMNAAAREAGKTTVKTAKESAEALEYMALAGWSVEDSTKALMPVLKLSAAAGMDLGTTSDLVTDTMAAMGLGINDLGHYLDVLAKGNNSANYNAQELLESYIGVGGVLKNLNVPVEKSAAVLGVMANQGLKGSKAGTALNAILVNMQKKSGDSFKAMQKLGISMYDTNGKTRDLIDVFQEVHDKTAGMTEEQRNLAYQMIGGKAHYEDFAKIMAGFNEDAATGTAQIYDLIKAYEGADGTLDKFYDIKTDTLEGAMLTLQSAYEGMLIDIGERASPIVNNAIDNLVSKIPDIENVIVASLERIMPLMDKVVDFATKNPDKIIKTVTGIAKAFMAFKAIKGLNEIALFVKNLNAITKSAGAIPVIKGIVSSLTGMSVAGGLAGLALAGVVAGIYAYKKHQKQLIEQNLDEHFGNIALSAQDCEQVIEKIFSNTTIRRASDVAEEFNKVDTYLSSMKDSGAAIQKYNWKASIGLKLSESEISDYSAQVENYVQSALSAVEQQHYSLTLSLKLLSDNPELQSEMKNIIESVYTGAEAELQALGKQMGDYVMEALADGIIDADEAETISAMQQKIADLTMRLTNAQSQAKLDQIALEFDFGTVTSDSFQNLQSKISEWISDKETSLKDVELEQLATINMLTEIPESALKNGFKGTLDEYKANLKQEIERAFQQERFKAHIQGIEVEIGGITKNYQTEVANATPQIESSINNFAADIGVYTGEALTNALGALPTQLAGSNMGGLDWTTKGTIKQLFDGMKEEVNSAQELKSSLQATGAEIPQSLLDGLHNANVIGAMAGDTDSALRLMGEQLAQQGKTDVLDRIQEIGGYAAEMIAQGAQGVMEIDADVEAGNVNAENLKQGIDETVQSATEGADGAIEVQQDADVTAGNVESGGFLSFIDNIINSIFHGTTAHAADLEVDTNINAGAVDTSSYYSTVQQATQSLPKSGNAQTVTVDTKVQANLDASSAKTSFLTKIKSLFGGSKATQNINVKMNATGNLQSSADNAARAVKNIPTGHNTNISVSGNALSTAQSIRSTINSLPSSKTITITTNHVTKGTPPGNNASGTPSWRGGLTYLNDQPGIADPREVVEYKGQRYWFGGRDVLADIPRGARIYNAAQSRSIIDGSHRDGLDYVPYDGYIAELHRGERVLTESDAEEYRDGGGLFGRAIDRLRYTRQESGANGGGSSEGDINVTYSPNIIIEGDADEAAVRRASRQAYDEFVENFERLMRERRRTSFDVA